MMYSDQRVPAVGAGCGAALRQAREAAGLSIEQVASQLKMTVRAVANLEADDFSSLGAPVFVRGQLRSYARLLGVDVESFLEHSGIAPVAPSTLVSHSYTPRYQRVAENLGRRAIYVAITVALVGSVWLGTRPSLDDSDVASLDTPVNPAATQSRAAESAAPRRTPMVASIAPLPAAQQAAPALSITFKGDSWVEVFDAQGRQIEQGTLSAGQQRSYDVGEVGRIKLGNVGAVEVKRAGTVVDLEPFSRANVARFTLSSDGSLAPVAN